jgi:hypothetical protein
VIKARQLALSARRARENHDRQEHTPGIAVPTGKTVSGEILFGGKDVLKFSNREMRRIRGNKIAMIFQDPMTALNPSKQSDTRLPRPSSCMTGLRAAKHRSAPAICLSWSASRWSGLTSIRTSFPADEAARRDRDGAGVQPGTAFGRRADDGT